MSHNRFALTALATAALALSACQTSIVASRTASGVGRLPFQRTAVVAAVAGGGRLDAARRAGEDAFARSIPGIGLEPTYPLLPSSEIVDAEKLRLWAASAGFDGLVAVWFDSAEPKTFPALEDIEERKVLKVLYRVAAWSLPDGRELWSATVRRADGLPFASDLEAVARMVGARWREEGLVGAASARRFALVRYPDSVRDCELRGWVPMDRDDLQRSEPDLVQANALVERLGANVLLLERLESSAASVLGGEPSGRRGSAAAYACAPDRLATLRRSDR